ncbi:MAG: family 10 glycosylhydrolase [Chitinophagaceae bacterium]|nr:family 10 glycosylhydrolase [Chitinophagaceae bacterium]
MYKKKFLSAALWVFPLFILAQTSNGDILRGTWITNVASKAMLTPENVKETVAKCKQNNLTDIFVVVWNNGVTMYPSVVAASYIGIKQSPIYNGFDPLQAFVEEGHKAGLKVHAWFEFGFSYAYKDSSNKGWLTKYPHWAAKNERGQLLQKNGFYWWNALNPEVQTLLTKLVLEVTQKYNVDGVQGDDRLPAMPAEGGYDEYTIALYKKEHAGVAPPAKAKDSAFVQWKANKLNAFGESLYRAVKKTKPNCLVTWAPSLYPWSKEQYLQDWPAWVAGGYADMIFPQLYRYDIKSYERILKELDAIVPASYKNKVFPGILTSLGDGYRVKPEMLREMMELNRKYGFKGEVWFYYESIREAISPLYK